MSATMELERICRCGCGGTLSPGLRDGSKYVDDRHKKRAFKARQRAAERARRALAEDLTPTFRSTEYREVKFCACPRPAYETWPQVGRVCVWCGHMVRPERWAA
jgi:hypothetical protein